MVSSKSILFNFKNMRSVLFFCVGMFCLCSCSIVRSSFISEPYAIAYSSRHGNNDSRRVDFFRNKPQRAAFRIGVINAKGNGFSNFDDLIKDAQKEAQMLGGDFVLPEDGGVDSQILYSPGYSNYSANVNGSYGRANGYSTGASISTINRPWAVFSVWVYTPSNIGIHIDEKKIVTGFHLNSDADVAGVKIGDLLIGIDGFDVQDQSLFSHIMEIMPGEKVKLTLLRDSKKIETKITSLSNF